MSKMRRVARPSQLPAELAADFSTADAIARGVSRRRLRARDLAAPFRGARSAAPALDAVGRAHALAPLLSADQRFSHVTAAEIHGMRMPEGARSGPLHVTHRDGTRGMRRPGVCGHKSTMPATPLVIRDLPTSTAVLAWCECSTLLSMDDLIVMGDGLVRRRYPPSTMAELTRAVGAWHGRRGASALRAAIEHIRPGTDSARETMLRLAVVRAGFPEPEANAPLIGRDGSVVGHGDLVWRDRRVVLEYEGRHHAEDPRQFAIDIRRLEDIAAAGYRVVRVDRGLLAHGTDLIFRIRRAFSDRDGS